MEFRRTVPGKQHTIALDLGLEMLRRRQGRRGRNLHQVGEPGASSAFVQYRHSVSDIRRGILLLQFRGQDVGVAGLNFWSGRAFSSLELRARETAKPESLRPDSCNRRFQACRLRQMRVGPGWRTVWWSVVLAGTVQARYTLVALARRAQIGDRLGQSPKQAGMGTPGVPQETSRAASPACISGNSSRLASFPDCESSFCVWISGAETKRVTEAGYPTNSFTASRKTRVCWSTSSSDRSAATSAPCCETESAGCRGSWRTGA